MRQHRVALGPLPNRSRFLAVSIAPIISRSIRVVGDPGLQSASNLSLCIPPRRLEIAHQRLRAGIGWRDRSFSHFAPERPADILLTCGKVGRFLLAPRQRVETRLVGWASRIRTWKFPFQIRPLKLRRTRRDIRRIPVQRLSPDKVAAMCIDSSRNYPSPTTCTDSQIPRREWELNARLRRALEGSHSVC